MREHSIQDGEHLITCWCNYKRPEHADFAERLLESVVRKALLNARTDDVICQVKRDLLPLLRAGEAMDEWKFDDNRSWAKMQELYRAAKAAAEAAIKT